MPTIQVKNIKNNRLVVYLTVPREIVNALDIRKGDEFSAIIGPETNSIIFTRVMQNVTEPSFPAKRRPGRPRKKPVTNLSEDVEAV